jgi:hypothetical protein
LVAAVFFRAQGFGSSGGDANHLGCGVATRLGAEAGCAAVAGVICGTPAATKSADFIFFSWFGSGGGCRKSPPVATQDRVFPYYVPNSSIKHSKSDSKNRSQEIL